MTSRAARFPIPSLVPSELVTIRLQEPTTETVNACDGRVLDVDATAIPLDASWSRFSLTPSPTSGVVIVPRGRVERIEVEGADQ